MTMHGEPEAALMIKLSLVFEDAFHISYAMHYADATSFSFPAHPLCWPKPCDDSFDVLRLLLMTPFTTSLKRSSSSSCVYNISCRSCVLNRGQGMVTGAWHSKELQVDAWFLRGPCLSIPFHSLSSFLHKHVASLPPTHLIKTS